MTLRTRRFIYLSFILFFFVIAPFLVLYASGFRFNFKRQQFEKTGVIFVESEPEDADIYINGKLFDEQTPGHATSLLPNTYDVLVTLENYKPWTNILEVVANQTTFIQSIQLFLDSPILEKIITFDTEKEISQSPDSRWLAWIDVNDLYIYDAKINQLKSVELPPRVTSSNIRIDEWSPGGRYFSVFSTRLEYIVDAETMEIIQPSDIPSLSVLNSSLVHFDQSQDELLYVYTESELQRLNMLTKSVSSTLLTVKLSDFYVNGNDLYLLANTTEGATVYTMQFSSDENPEKVFSVSRSPEISFVSSSEEMIALLDSYFNNLHLIRPSSDTYVSHTIRGVENATWSPDKEKLLLTNPFEVRFYQFEYGDYASEGKMKTLTRLSEIIPSASWYNDSAHVFFVAQGKLFVSELFQASKRNTWELLNFDSIKNVFTGIDKKELYVQALDEREYGLYRVEVQ